MAQKALSFLIFLCGLSRAGEQPMPTIHPTLSREYCSKRSCPDPKQWAWTQDFPCLPLLTHRLNLLGPRVSKQLKIYIQSLAFWLIISVWHKPKTFKAPTNLLKLWLDRQVCLPCHPPGAPCPRPRLRHQLAPLHPLLHRLSSIKLQISACLVSIFQRQITLY